MGEHMDIYYCETTNPRKVCAVAKYLDIDANYPLVVGYNSTNGNGAHCTVGGVWTNGSDRDSKEDFRAIDPFEIL